MVFERLPASSRSRRTSLGTALWVNEGRRVGNSTAHPTFLIAESLTQYSRYITTSLSRYGSNSASEHGKEMHIYLLDGF